MCVGCSRGFEIVDLESLDTQGLLDPNDESLEFVRKRENLRPMVIYRILNEFLLCYDGEFFSFFFSEHSGLLMIVFFFLKRVCVLCRQKRTAVAERVHGALGGHAYRVW